MKEQRKLKKNNIELYCFAGKDVCNRQLVKMWKRVIPLVHGLRGVYWADFYIRKLLCLVAKKKVPVVKMPGGEKLIVSSRINEKLPHLYFTAKEKMKGQEFVRPLIQDQEKGFVCFHSRTNLYLKEAFPKCNLLYHNYRDSDASSFKQACENLADLGYTLFRMGAKNEPLLESDNSYVIDYANNFKTPFLDIYLPSHCQFYIGDTSGLSTIPAIFKRPVGITNAVPLNWFALLLLKSVTYVPKLYWSDEKSRLLTFQEMLSEPFLSFSTSEDYERAGITLINNTSQDIAELAEEIYLKHIGVWKESSINKKRQLEFIKHLKNTKIFVENNIRGSVSAAFLERNEHLL